MASTINAVTQEFIQICSLDYGPLSDLADGKMGINGFAGLFSQHLGYVIIRVQIEGVRGYDKDHVALVIPDSTTFDPEGQLLLVHQPFIESSM